MKPNIVDVGGFSFLPPSSKLLEKEKEKKKNLTFFMTTIPSSLLWFFAFFFFFSSLSSISIGVSSHTMITGASSIASWCNETPHPEPCNFYLQISKPPRDTTAFRQMLLQATIDQAIAAQGQVQQLETNCNTPNKKSVWFDCSQLYSDIILQLNRTLDGLTHGKLDRGHNCSDFDAQTWLSAALTNIDTCGLGFQDMNISDFISPTASTQNLTQLISNSLAVNGASLTSEEKGGETTPRNGGFPRWVLTHDRKLLQSSSSVIKKANAVVAKDGSGLFRTIQAALDAAAKRKSTSKRFIIYVKKGVYKEYINVAIGNDKVMMVGDGIRNTIITGSRSVGGGYTTFSCATAGIEAVGFIARGITFSNTAGPQKGQAVALRSASDLSVFYQCSFQGYQDTLFVLSQRQFYKRCYIYGTIDFIFGNAAVVFQNCIIYARKPLHGQANVITAQGRNDPYQNTGISIHNSQVLADSDLLEESQVATVKTYLGRPWMRYSRTVFMKTYLGSLVTPLGWSTWDGTNYALNTLYYGEYTNYGPGAPTEKRVNWKGYRVIKNASVASLFTVGRFIAGGSWLPATGMPFTSGL